MPKIDRSEEAIKTVGCHHMHGDKPVFRRPYDGQRFCSYCYTFQEAMGHEWIWGAGKPH